MYQSEFISSKDVGISLLQLVDILEQQKQEKQIVHKDKRPSTANAILNQTRRRRLNSTSNSNTFNLPTTSSHYRQQTKHHYNDKFIKFQTDRLLQTKKQTELIKKHKLIKQRLRPKTAEIFKYHNNENNNTLNSTKDFYYSQSLQRYQRVPSKLEDDHLNEFLNELKQKDKDVAIKSKQSVINKRRFRRAESKWRIQKRMREKLELDIKTGRIGSNEILQQFDKEMKEWMDNELNQQFDIPSNQITDYKQHKNVNLWRNVDKLSNKQISLSLNPLHSMKIVKCVVDGVTKQIVQQQKNEKKQQKLHQDIKDLLHKQMRENREKETKLNNSYNAININYINNSKFSTKKQYNKNVQKIHKNPTFSKRPSTAIVVSSRIEHLSKPVYRKNRLDRFGFDNPDLHNVIIPKSITDLSQCYEALNNGKAIKNPKKSEKLGKWVESEIFNFEESLRLKSN